MKAMVIIPDIPYSVLLRRCDMTSPEYLLLKNGVHENNLEQVHVLCNSEQADFLIEYIGRIAQDLLPAVRKIDIPL